MLLPAQTLTHTFPMAASTASRIFTPILHRHQRRTKAVVVAAASPPDAEPTPATADGAGPGKKKTVDTRIHWSNPDEGWVGGKAKKEGDGRGSSKNEPLGGRFADLINNAAESHYQLSSSPIHAHMSFWIAVQLYINL
jgi:NAD(P)H-quinone oxidoreductase subunit T, chloroplastic